MNTRRHQEAADEIARLRETVQALAAQTLATRALLTSMLCGIAREQDYRGILSVVAAHACDLIAETPLDGAPEQVADLRDRAAVSVDDLRSDLMRNFAIAAVHRLRGSNSSWDAVCFINSVTRSMDFRSFTMSAHVKNHSPETQGGPTP